MSDADAPSNLIDPDDTPELTDEWVEKATSRSGDTVTRRGRPPGSDKTQVSPRLETSRQSVPDQGSPAALRIGSV